MVKQIRISELARELEIKPRVILDALPALGIDGKKTHSSNIDLESAEKIRRHFQAAAQTEVEPEEAEAAPVIAAEAEQKPETQAIPERAAKPVLVASAPASGQVEPAARTVKTPQMGIRMTAPVARRHATVVSPTKPATVPPAATTPAAPAEPATPAVLSAPVTSIPAPVASTTATAPPPAAPIQAAPPASPNLPAPAAPRTLAPPSLRPAAAGPSTPAPAVPGRRVIVPVAPQRPVYKAPEQPLRPAPGKPILNRGTAPVPGKPIYQRPAPAGARPPMPGKAFTPEGRRPPHPTRASAGRPAGQAGRRQHEPRVKEGPLKYQPKLAEVPSGPLPIDRSITISEGISVKDLSERLQVRAKDVIRKLLDRGLMATVNQSLDTEIAKQIAREFGAEAQVVSFEEEALKELEPAMLQQESEKLQPRAPVVTIMGHVDHGKTSLLDAIRETNVAGGEAGGITQHIGAYSVEITDRESPAFGRRIVFIDTPGHEAFTRMRARGAKVTDLVVLVVAADDGVMPQTLEAIDHARAASVPILVAVNKIDKPGAQPDRVKKQLADRGLMPEVWGGQTVMVDVSAKTKANLKLLLEMILLVSDLQSLKADPEQPGQGTVLDAELDRGRGPVAHALMQNGCLKVGDTVIAGAVMGKVRALFDDRGRPISEAGPSMPVEILGLEGLPDAGDRIVAVQDRFKAKQIVIYREQKARESAMARSSRLNLESLSQQMAEGQMKELPLIIKADVQGSVEVLVDTLNRQATAKVKPVIIHSGVGAITENDVLLAAASNAIIIGFNVRPERKATELAEQEKVDIRLHSIIYELAEEMDKAMAGLLEPTFKETVLGRAEVRDTFRIPKVGAIAGCYVREGKLTRDSQVRVLRDHVVIYTSKISSLRHFKQDVNEIRSNMECGVGIANFSDVKTGDVLESFIVEKIAAPATA